MQFSNMLAENGTPPTAVDTSADVSFNIGEGGITGIELTVTAKIDGIDDADFQRLAEEAKSSCPVSKALAGVDITLKASLADRLSEHPGPCRARSLPRRAESWLRSEDEADPSPLGHRPRDRSASRALTSGRSQSTAPRTLSVEDAQRDARERMQRVVASGGPARGTGSDVEYYPDCGACPRSCSRSFTDRTATLIAAITRNRYGSAVLNTDAVLITRHRSDRAVLAGPCQGERRRAALASVRGRPCRGAAARAGADPDAFGLRSPGVAESIMRAPWP